MHTDHESAMLSSDYLAFKRCTILTPTEYREVPDPFS